ncbi:NAD(P)/FAD-dependent oxidoreductase [Hydrogenophaga sp.]|uniref:flavin-containing monooxygenase n=1 Tax=Hydrogenophaga sp. TaxID=1904254 RepID=UPI002629C6BB|nr:NAD(P)/FAD-dependent oxidoreductase [Hydrogenophaga sp.]MCW5655130.1 NAD(P)/FAD-dependent oxidoreductase [Hydrogenophaga sp.]
MILHSRTPSEGLADLEARLKQDLAWLGLPPRPWMPPTREGVLDVAIIGGGQAGLAAATALRHAGIAPVVFDRSPEGFEGPWATTARMETLRSPKELTGPALGLPALTFRAWFEAQFGEAAWQALDKIPRLQWMDYLRWYRRVMEVDVRNEHRLVAIQPRADRLVALTIETAQGCQDWLARRVVLATGFAGLGGPSVPDFVTGLPPDRWAHSSDTMDYRLLAGQRVGVVGASASAMDSAATALECGAASVDILIRRKDFPRANKAKGAGNPGLSHGHVQLPDAWKWKIRQYINAEQTPPPHGSTLRVSRHANARFHFACPIQGARLDGGALQVDTGKGRIELDFLIFATGFRVDWNFRPEFALLGQHLKAWRDVYQPPADKQDASLSEMPYLGPVFELQERVPGTLPGLDRVHCFCFPALLTHGTVAGDIPGISIVARRLADGMAAQFYAEDRDFHFANIQSYAEPELYGYEWTPAGPLAAPASPSSSQPSMEPHT